MSRGQIDLNKWEVEFTEVKISKEEYEKRIVRLVQVLIEIDRKVVNSESAPSELQTKEAA
jgi:hypothetical protein